MGSEASNPSRGTANYPTMHRTAPMTKNDPVWNVTAPRPKTSASTHEGGRGHFRALLCGEYHTEPCVALNSPRIIPFEERFPAQTDPVMLVLSVHCQGTQNQYVLKMETESVGRFQNARGGLMGQKTSSGEHTILSWWITERGDVSPGREEPISQKGMVESQKIYCCASKLC